MTEYALYEGDDYIFGGTIHELAKYMKVSIDTVRFMATPTHKKRIENHKFKKDNRFVIRLDDEEES